MLLDGKHILCESFDLGAAATTSGVNVTNVVNLGIGADAYGNSQTPDISNDGEIHLNVTCEDEDFADTGGGTVITYDLHTDTTTAMSSPTTIQSFIGDETPNDGDQIHSQPLPAGAIEQYITLNVATDATLSAGKISAYLTNHPLRTK